MLDTVFDVNIFHKYLFMKTSVTIKVNEKWVCTINDCVVHLMRFSDLLK